MITWLASYPKSGNTWLRMFLHAYSYGDVNINDLREFDADDLMFSEWHNVSPKPVETLTPVEMMALRSTVLMHVAMQNRLRTSYRKTHFAVGRWGEFPLIPEFLTNRAVLIVRDPRDVAVSWAAHTQRPMGEIVEFMGDPSSAFTKAPGLFQICGSWSMHARSWLGAGGLVDGAEQKWPVMAIRYEDMVSSPVQIFAKVVEHLQWAVDPDRVARAVDAVQFAKLRRQESEGGFIEAPSKDRPFFRDGRVGGWRDVLTVDQARKLVDDHGEVMEVFGYAP